MDAEKREVGGWWMWILGLVVVTVLVFTGLSYAGIIGRTVVEREVFDESYQKVAGDEQRIATFEAQKAEIEGRLNNPELDETTRANLEAQLSAINIQLDAANRRAQQ